MPLNKLFINFKMADSLDYLLIKCNQIIYDVHISYIIIKINATKYLR